MWRTHQNLFQIVVVTIALFGLSGCAMQTQVNQFGESFVAFGEHQLLTKEQARKLDRDQRVTRIDNDMKKVGFRHHAVSPIFDSVSQAILSVFRNQRSLLKKYKILVDNHRDVMSFVMANKDKTPQELKIEAERFDRRHSNNKEKIATKLKEYQAASNSIQAENARLAAELVLLGARLSLILRDNFEEMLKLEGIAMLLNAHRTNQGFELAQARIHMTRVANEFIEEEKSVIEITKEIQKILDTKL